MSSYPIYNPPVHSSVVFSFDKKDSPTSKNDPRLHPLYGIAVHEYDWPEPSEYQSAFCPPQNRELHEPVTNACAKGTCCKPYTNEFSHDNGARSRAKREDLSKLYDPTPIPLLDQHFKGYYYRIDDPIGVVTNEEVTKCLDTVLGLVKIRTRDEMENTYLPNYRYKEWTEQPQLRLVQQLEYTYPLCRLPHPDTRHWDLYHQVRMGRPSPVLKGEKFGVCSVIPIPR